MASVHDWGPVWPWLTGLATKYDATYLKWLIQTVFFAVFGAITFRIPWIIWRFTKNVSDENLLFFRGYLYHFATAPLKKSLLRRTIIKIRPGILNPIIVRQVNEVPKRKMYSGSAEIIGETMSIAMASNRSGAKLLNIYTLRKVRRDLTFSLGMMAGINQDGDPWSVPVLLSSRPLPAQQLAPILEKIGKKPIDKRARSEVEALLRSLSNADDMGQINHPWGTDGEQTT